MPNVEDWVDVYVSLKSFFPRLIKSSKHNQAKYATSLVRKGLRMSQEKFSHEKGSRIRCSCQSQAGANPCAWQHTHTWAPQSAFILCVWDHDEWLEVANTNPNASKWKNKSEISFESQHRIVHSSIMPIVSVKREKNFASLSNAFAWRPVNVRITHVSRTFASSGPKIQPWNIYALSRICDLRIVCFRYPNWRSRTHRERFGDNFFPPIKRLKSSRKRTRIISECGTCNCSKTE